MDRNFDELAKLFARFPGIGERQSKRFVYHLLREPAKNVDRLSELVRTLKKNVAQCPICFRYFSYDGNEYCDICANPKTDFSKLLVIEKDADLENVRKSHAYKGGYFVLGGLVPIADSETLEKVRLTQLLARVTSLIKEETLEEIILAFPLTPHGEHTESIIRERLHHLLEGTSVQLTSLGRGLSTGSELEYADRQTLENSLNNRK
jgi:recombination protein RecR